MLTASRIRQIKRFGITGIMVTGVHVVVAASFINYIVAIPWLANGVAFVTATISSYLLNTLWSFSSPLKRSNLYRFIGVSGLGFTMAVSISRIIELLGYRYWIGIAFVVLIVPPLTFILHSSWTYKEVALRSENT